MAGTPKKRARREQETPVVPVDFEIPTSVPSVPNAMRAGVRARPYAARVAQPLGPSVRATADAGQAMALAELGRHIRPGYVLRLERMRPSWCDGWVEDIPVESASMGELYRQIREEFGGTHYRVIVLGPQETPVYEGRISISEPPRRRGRPIDRDGWEQALEGRSRAANPQPVAAVAAAPSDASSGMNFELMKMLFQQQRETSDATLAAVKELMNRTAGMVSEVLQQRETSNARSSLSEQLGELVEGTRAIQRAGKVFGAAAGAGDGGEGDVSDSMVKQAGSIFLAKMAGDMMGGGAPKPPNGHPVTPAQRPGFIPVSQPIPRSPQK